MKRKEKERLQKVERMARHFMEEIQWQHELGHPSKMPPTVIAAGHKLKDALTK